MYRILKQVYQEAELWNGFLAQGFLLVYIDCNQTGTEATVSNERLVPIISNCQWLVNCNNVNNNNKCIYIHEASGCHRCFVSNVSLVLKRTKSGEESLLPLRNCQIFPLDHCIFSHTI